MGLGDINLIAKIAPYNDGFTGLVDAKHVIGGAGNVLPSTVTTKIQNLDSTLASGFVKITTSTGALTADTNTYLTSVTAHNLLSTTHGDTTASTVARGDLVVGIGVTPTWDNLALGTIGKILRSDGTDLKYTTATFADTYGASTLLYANGANTVQGLTTGNSGVLVTSGAGVPSIATDIPTAVTIGGAYVYRASGTDVPVADGGTGASTFALNGVLYGNATSAVGVTAIGAAGQVLRVGATPFVPAWSTATYPNTTTAFRLLASTATSVIGELAAVGATGEYLAGSTGAIPAWATLNQAAVAGLTTAASPTFVGLNLTGDTNQIVLNSDGGVAALTLTGASATSAKTITFPNTTGTVYVSSGTDVAVTDGGTGLSTLTTAYGLLAAGTTATGTVQTLAAGATTQILVGGGASALPAWGTDLPTAVTIGSAYVYRAAGTDIPITDGGTGLSTLTTAYGLLAAGTTATGTIQTLAAGATTQILVGGGASAIPAWGTNLPTAVTIGSAYIYRASGTDVPVADGGTGLSTIADGSVLATNTADTLTAITWHSAGTKVLTNTSGVISWETAGAGGYTNLTSFVDQTAWRSFYSDGSGDVKELAFGTAGKVLTSNGATAAPTWEDTIVLTHTVVLDGDFGAAYATSAVKKFPYKERGSGITITSITVQSDEADPATEFAGDLKKCTAHGTGAFPGGSPTVIQAIDTTTGNYSSGAISTAVATGLELYIQMDSAPGAGHIWTISINYSVN